MALSVSVRCFFGSLDRVLAPIATSAAQLRGAYAETHDASAERSAVDERLRGVSELLVRPAPARIGALLAAADLLEEDIEQRLGRITAKLKEKGCLLPPMPERELRAAVPQSDAELDGEAAYAAQPEESEPDNQGGDDAGVRTPPTPELRGILSLRSATAAALSPIAAVPAPAARRVLSLTEESPAPVLASTVASTTTAPATLPTTALLSPILPHTAAAPLSRSQQPSSAFAVPSAPPPAPTPAPTPTLEAKCTAPQTAAPTPAPPVATAACAPAPPPVATVATVATAGGRTGVPVEEAELASVPVYLRAQVSLSQLNELRGALAAQIAAHGCVRETDAVTLLGGGARAKAVLLLLIKVARLRSVMQGGETVFVAV